MEQWYKDDGRVQVITDTDFSWKKDSSGKYKTAPGYPSAVATASDASQANESVLSELKKQFGSRLTMFSFFAQKTIRNDNFAMTGKHPEYIPGNNIFEPVDANKNNLIFFTIFFFFNVVASHFTKFLAQS